MPLATRKLPKSSEDVRAVVVMDVSYKCEKPVEHSARGPQRGFPVVVLKAGQRKLVGVVVGAVGRVPLHPGGIHMVDPLNAGRRNTYPLIYFFRQKTG